MSQFSTGIIAIVALASSIGTSSFASAGETLYVDWDAPEGGDGLSWLAPLRDLQEAIARTADEYTEIRIAGGTYSPAGPNGDRTATFVAPTGVALRGGYAGFGTVDPDDRDLELYPTYLSGDLNGDDEPDFVNHDENVYHVVTLSGTSQDTLLDGIIIAGGNADGDESPATCFGGPNNGQECFVPSDCVDAPCVSINSMGAGMIMFGGSPTIRDCRVQDNYSAFQGAGLQAKQNSRPMFLRTTFERNYAVNNGGAAYLGNSRPSFVECSFVDNTGAQYAGATCNRDHSDALFQDCQFINNVAALATPTGGGAMVNASSSPTLVRCTFEGNSANAGAGGAIYNKMGFNPALGPSKPVLVDCEFSGNSAVHGGAVYNIEESQPEFTACEFHHNFIPGGAVGTGGAMYNEGASPILTDCVFNNNVNYYGGAIYNTSQSNPLIERCRFVENTVVSQGGAIYNVDGSSPSITDCVFRKNETLVDAIPGSPGGAVYNLNMSDPSIDRCWFIENSAQRGGAIYSRNSTPRVTRSTFIGNTSRVAGGAIFNDNADSVLESCTFSGNAAGTLDHGSGGAIVQTAGSDGAIGNCTFSNNLAISGEFGAGTGGGIANFAGSDPVITNCIFWNNVDGSGSVSSSQIYMDMETEPSDPIVNYSCVQGGWPGAGGTGNVDVDPLFVNALGGDGVPGSTDDDLRLESTSGSIDTGDPKLMMEQGERDLDGHARVLCAAVDMGAYEFGIGDFDCNRMVDLLDFSEWAGCETGPETGGYPPGCEAVDFDFDGKVDFEDFRGFQVRFDDNDDK